MTDPTRVELELINSFEFDAHFTRFVQIFQISHEDTNSNQGKEIGCAPLWVPVTYSKKKSPSSTMVYVCASQAFHARTRWSPLTDRFHPKKLTFPKTIFHAVTKIGKERFFVL